MATDPETAICHVCGLTVPLDAREAHLRSAHPAPDGGFVWFYEQREYRSEEPSLTVSDVLRRVGGNVMYTFYIDHGGDDVALSHANAVDLTQRPHFYSVPPATF